MDQEAEALSDFSPVTGDEPGAYHAHPGPSGSLLVVICRRVALWQGAHASQITAAGCRRVQVRATNPPRAAPF